MRKLNTLIFDKDYKDSEELLNSEYFIESLFDFIHNCKINYEFPSITSFNLNIIVDNLKDLINNKQTILNRKELFYFIESFYDYWRSINKFLFLYDSNYHKLESVLNKQNLLFLSTYRKIQSKIADRKIVVYRELSAFFNCIFSYTYQPFKLLGTNYQNFKTINRLIFRPPFILRSDSNKRISFFEINNHIEEDTLYKEYYYILPLYISDKIALVYLNDRFIKYALPLVNLFDVVKSETLATHKIDIILVAGTTNTALNNQIKETNDYLVGYISDSSTNDYFGNLKKILLTMHNIIRIKEGCLPIHGAGIELVLENKTINCILIGDSGTGKSESIDALSQNKEIKKINIIYDDMGYLKIKNNTLYTYGTEIGAFVRLDDLDKSYSYKQLDRAILVNPEKSNGRTVYPVSTFRFITEPHKVDFILYANNYEDLTSISLFDNIDRVKEVFVRGRRFSLGTTQEIGIVDSYFANPFGPMQLQNLCDKLIDKYFKFALKNNITVGQFYTRLGLVDKKETGPKLASIELLKLFNK